MCYFSPFSQYNFWLELVHICFCFFSCNTTQINLDMYMLISPITLSFRIQCRFSELVRSLWRARSFSAPGYLSTRLTSSPIESHTARVEWFMKTHAQRLEYIDISCFSYRKQYFIYTGIKMSCAQWLLCIWAPYCYVNCPRVYMYVYLKCSLD